METISLVAKPLELNATVGLWLNDGRLVRFYLSRANPNFSHRIHQLTQEQELEPGVTKGINASIGFVDDAGCLQRVLNIIR